MKTIEEVTKQHKDLALQLGDLDTTLKLSWLELVLELHLIDEIEICKELVHITSIGK